MTNSENRDHHQHQNGAFPPEEEIHNVEDRTGKHDGGGEEEEVGRHDEEHEEQGDDDDDEFERESVVLAETVMALQMQEMVRQQKTLPEDGF
jgi:hypothetical protein